MGIVSHVPLSVRAPDTWKTMKFDGAPSLRTVTVVRTAVVVESSHVAMSAAMAFESPSVSEIRSDVMEASVVESNFSVPEPGSVLAVFVE